MPFYWLAFGDSKSLPGRYNTYLEGMMAGIGRPTTVDCSAVGGATVAIRRSTIDADLAAISTVYEHVLINMGANDVLSLPAQATWEANLGYILDAMHVKWPSAHIWVMRGSWSRGRAAECATLKVWIGNVTAARAGWAHDGPDETVFIENGDDGARYNPDGVHPNYEGYVLTAAKWKEAVGYPVEYSTYGGGAGAGDPMTLQTSFGMMLPAPSMLGNVNVAAAYSSLLMDAAAEKVAWIFRAPKAGVLARAHFRTGTVTTGDTLKVSFQDVSAANGDPDGTPDQYRTVSVLDANDNTWFRTELLTSDGTDNGTKRTVTAGELVAMVIEFNSWVAGSLNIVGTSSGGARYPWVGNSYYDHFTSSWAKQASFFPTMAVEYDDGSFAFLPGAVPASAITTLNISSASTPDEAGLLITLPFKARVWGAWVGTTMQGDAEVVLYDTDGSTVLGTVSYDKDVTPFSTSSGVLALQFATPPTLLPGAYRLVLKPSTSTAQLLAYYDVSPTPGAALLDQMDGGQGIHWTQRTDAGVWSQTTTRRAVMGLIFSAFDDGATYGGRTHIHTVLPTRRRRRRRAA